MAVINPKSKVIDPFEKREIDVDNCIKYTRHIPKGIELSDIEKQIHKYELLADYSEPTKPAPLTHNVQGVKTTYNGENFDSYWEVAFYRFKKEIEGHVVVRNYDKYLMYTNAEGKISKFYYDFEVDGMPAECKGRWRPNDLCKMQQCPQVTFYDGVQIKPMIRELNKKFPKWREECALR